jgi:hypothetical protein
MTTDEVELKAVDLLVPVLGESRARDVVAMVRHLEQVPDVRQLTNLLQRAD